MPSNYRHFFGRSDLRYLISFFTAQMSFGSGINFFPSNITLSVFPTISLHGLFIHPPLSSFIGQFSFLDVVVHPSTNRLHNAQESPLILTSFSSPFLTSARLSCQCLIDDRRAFSVSLFIECSQVGEPAFNFRDI